MSYLTLLYMLYISHIKVAAQRIGSAALNVRDLRDRSQIWTQERAQNPILRDMG